MHEISISSKNEVWKIDVFEYNICIGLCQNSTNWFLPWYLISHPDIIQFKFYLFNQWILLTYQRVGMCRTFKKTERQATLKLNFMMSKGSELEEIQSVMHELLALLWYNWKKKNRYLSRYLFFNWLTRS